MTDEFLPWAAGYFEGEGTLTISVTRRYKGRAYTRPVVVMTSTDREVIDLFHARWGGHIRTSQPPGNARLAYVWSISNATILRFLEDLAPFWRLRRVQAKADLLREDLLARQMGRGGEGYLERCHERMDRIRRLNHRGKK